MIVVFQKLTSSIRGVHCKIDKVIVTLPRHERKS